MQITRGMRRQSAKFARRREMVPSDTGLAPGEVAALPAGRFARLLRRHLAPGRRFSPWMAGCLRAAARDVRPVPETSGATLRWRLAAERIGLADTAVAAFDARLFVLLEATGYGRLRGQIRGLADVTLANLLALTGDPARFDDARCLPGHAAGAPGPAARCLPGGGQPRPPPPRLPGSLRGPRRAARPAAGVAGRVRGDRQQAATHALGPRRQRRRLPGRGGPGGGEARARRGLTPRADDRVGGQAQQRVGKNPRLTQGDPVCPIEPGRGLRGRTWTLLRGAGRHGSNRPRPIDHRGT